MGLFTKKCMICSRKLPDKRKFKGVCDMCGSNAKNYQKQLAETIKVVEDGKNALTAFRRCQFGGDLVNRMEPFVNAGGATYPAGTADEQFKYFNDKMNLYLQRIHDENEKRKLPKKVGVPPANFKSFNNDVPYEEGACKGCHGKVPVNDAGYCHDCIVRATRVNQSDLMEYAKEHSVKGHTDQELVTLVAEWRLAQTISK